MERNKYITIPELAEILGLSRVAVFKKVKKGEIKAIKIGRNYAIPKKFIANLNYFLQQILDPISKGTYTATQIDSW